LKEDGGSGEALPAGSVITHYDTFIPSVCKVSWALRGGVGGAGLAAVSFLLLWRRRLPPPAGPPFEKGTLHPA